ncbi:MAG: type II toxin-antitoxin system HicB family antitoxin [Chloroflexi bacterium]|nr:type II toxin-antitoxin system HicB family antitoxin [Chloroflexota bacterium]
MATYTALLFTSPDGSHTARVPALSRPGQDCQAQGRTRAEALGNAARAAAAVLADVAQRGQPPPQEEWSPARTVHVQDPRRSGTIPYVICVERAEDGCYAATPVLFPEIHETAASVEEALSLLGPRLYAHLVGLAAQGRGFPVQDDPNAYVIQVPEMEV